MDNAEQNKKKGYIMLWRSMFDNPMWQSEPFTRSQAWIDLLQLAHYKEEPSHYYIRGNKVDVEYGFVCTGKKYLAERWRWSNKKLNNFLKQLKKAHQINIHESRIITRIEILNYSKY